MNDWSEDVTLIGTGGFTKDDYGNQIPKEDKTTVMASTKPIAMGEFYAAAQAGIRPEVELIIHTFEYNGELAVDYRGVRYSVVRTYQRNDDELEIYLERKVSDVGKAD